MVEPELSAADSNGAELTIGTEYDSLNLEQKTKVHFPNLERHKSCVVSKAILNGVEHDGCQPRHQPPTLEAMKCGDTPRGSSISWADPTADTTAHRRTMAAAWESLKESMVYFRGQPIGTVAAIDKSQAELNYDQVFMRDFVPSALAFLLKGEPLIGKNFLLETARLQSREKMVDLFKLGQGVMPASFKVHHLHPTQKIETLLADFSEIAIGRIAPVDSGLWWIFLLHAYTKYTLDNSLSESPDCQRAMCLILKLWLSEGFDTSPALLCADGCSMIDCRMLSEVLLFCNLSTRNLMEPELSAAESNGAGLTIGTEYGSLNLEQKTKAHFTNLERHKSCVLSKAKHDGCQPRHQPPTLEAIKCGDTPRGSSISWADPTADTAALHKRTMAAAWESLEQSIVYFRGQPIGTVAVIDKSQAELNYDQVFMRDFVPSALAFLMKGEPLIVKNFLLETARLQSREKMVDLFKLGQGVMPASFKVHHLHPTQKIETLLADFGEIAIGRVAPVDSGLRWIFLLHADTKYTLDNSLSESPDCQRAMPLILKLWLSEGFDISPVLLCTDGCSMIDRRMGMYGSPTEIQSLFFKGVRSPCDYRDAGTPFENNPPAPTYSERSSTGHLKMTKKSCRSMSLMSVLRIATILLVIFNLSGLASASAQHNCEVGSLATNIRVFCSESHPSSLCCDSIRAAVTGQDGLDCLCLVGNSPDILTMGFSAQSLIGLNNICSSHDHEYDCNDDSKKTSHVNEKSGAEADDEEERPRQQDQLKNARRSDAKDDSPRQRADPKDSEERPRQRDQTKKTHKSDRKDHHSKTKESSIEVDHGDDVHPRKERTDVPQESDDQPQHHGGLDSDSSSSSTVGFLSGFIVLLLVSIVITAVVLRYKRQRTDFRQLLSVALASAVPPVHATPCSTASPGCGQGTVTAQAALPVQAPRPLTDELQIADGLPVPPVVPQPPLAIFPAGSDIVTILGFAVLERMRRRVWA